jgi:hypothetical protein
LSRQTLSANQQPATITDLQQEAVLEWWEHGAVLPSGTNAVAAATKPNNELSAPSGYICHGDLFADLSESYGSGLRLIVVANLLALIPLGVAVILLWLPYQFYVALGTPLALFDNPAWPQWIFLVVGLIVVVGSLFVHEGLHGVALLLQGHRPKFGYESGYPFAAIQPGEFLTRRQYLAMALTPLSVMTLIGSLLLLLLPASLGQIILITLLLNAAACIGDLAVADRARRWPSSALFAADDTGIKVFTREEN